MTLVKKRRVTGFAPEEISARINEFVVEQHADDAAFLWTIRDQAVRAPNFSLKDLIRWDRRVEAHLDGLRVAGAFGWQLCARAMAREEPGEVFAASVLALNAEDSARIHEVLEVGAAPELQRGLISALGWLPFPEVEPRLAEFLRSPEPAVRRVGIAAHAVHRHDPGASLEAALSDADPRLRVRALEAVGELGRADLLGTVQRSISDPEERVRFSAAWSATRLGDRSASLSALRGIASGSTEFAEPAMSMALRVMPLNESAGQYREMRADPQRQRWAVRAAGIVGDPGLVEDLIAFMEVEALARVAGESFSMITGVDLAYHDLEGDRPEELSAGPNESPEDENVETDPDERLPWPDPLAVKKWWDRHRADFRAGRRFLKGREHSPGSLRETLIDGNQRQRAAAGLELALLNPSRPLFEVRARGDDQFRRLEAATS